MNSKLTSPEVQAQQAALKAIDTVAEATEKLLETAKTLPFIKKADAIVQPHNNGYEVKINIRPKYSRELKDVNEDLLRLCDFSLTFSITPDNFYNRRAENGEKAEIKVGLPYPTPSELQHLSGRTVLHADFHSEAIKIANEISNWIYIRTEKIEKLSR